MKNLTTHGLKAMTAGLLLASSLGAQASLLNSYDFTTGLGDTLGNGADLVASGGTVTGDRYSFGANQGLRLADALADTSNYGIELRFQVSDSVAGYNKFLDFQDLASDVGLYVHNGDINFYTVGAANGPIAAGTDYTVAIERAANDISLFLDGNLVFSGTDAGRAVSAANVLNFFEDDNATGQRESFTGSVDFIRIHEDRSTFGTAPTASVTVSEPGLLGLVLAGVLGVAARRRT